MHSVRRKGRGDHAHISRPISITSLLYGISYESWDRCLSVDGHTLAIQDLFQEHLTGAAVRERDGELRNRRNMLLGIRQSSFAPLSGPRSPLAAAQTTDEHNSSSSGNPSSSRRQQMLNHRQQQPSSTGRASGSRGGGKRGRDGGACPPSRLERTREERGAAQKQQQQQQREGGGRELGNAGTRSDNGVSATTPLAASSSTAGIVMENGRDTRRGERGRRQTPSDTETAQPEVYRPRNTITPQTFCAVCDLQHKQMCYCAKHDVCRYIHVCVNVYC